MPTRFAEFATARPRIVLLVALLLALIGGGFGATVPGHLSSGGYLAADLESVRANRFIQDNFPGGNPNYVVLITAADGVESPAARAVAEQVAQRMRSDPNVTGVQSFWSTRPDLALGLRSRDGRGALIVAKIAGDDSQVQRRTAALAADIERDRDGVAVRGGGLAGVVTDVNAHVQRDLIVAEAIALPVSAILLTLVFGSVIAALLPVAIGLFATAATLGMLRALTAVTDVSVFALNMTTALGLALAIDYSLFIVSRYREELAAGRDTRAAVIRAVQTAGRTVVYSGLAVALAMVALLVFPQVFFRSFAYAGVPVVAAAVGASVLILPAALLLLGDRVNALDLRKPLRRWLRRGTAVAVPPERSWWYRLVVAVMQRPLRVAVAGVAVLLLLGTPFLSAQFAAPDDRVLPTSASSRIVSDALRRDFDADMAAGLVAALPGFDGPSAEIGSYAAELSRIDGVRGVLSSAGVYAGGLRVAAGVPEMASAAGTYLSIVTRAEPSAPEGETQLAALRAVHPPGAVEFSGAAAINADSIASIAARLPLAIALIAVVMLAVLFLFTGSVLLPLKALLLNTLSLTATFGAMVWVFQDGHLSGLLGFTPTGTTNLYMPILMFCLAFGMSMDYEVFLLSRIREEWLDSDGAPQANTHAVAMGTARTGPIFTAAAGLMAVVLLAVATSEVAIMKLFGIGLALAVIADATVIRLLLVPALMRLFSTRNWWSPKPLAALHARFGLAEAEPVDPEVQVRA
ncbi:MULTISPECIES: MMPL family transporter [unclassified Nocardia]|uniref:MMPL family transporter n=1 Tax=unclassified Nocardia TaxID=2637762 RepID=UPI001CE42409|nr:MULTISPECIES: MMPL family transporter [unclassified Nocardia]